MKYSMIPKQYNKFTNGEAYWRLFFLAFVFLRPASAEATQMHGGMEGLYVHQMAHIFFAFSMGLLIFWLHKWRLTASAGWRHIYFAALFLIVWNLDTIVSHWLVEQSGLIVVENLSPTRIHLTTLNGSRWPFYMYYLTKLDHLLCVPALVFLFLGLRRLLLAAPNDENRGEISP